MSGHHNISDSVLNELSKTVEQFCSQFSISNVVVPRFDSCKDVFTFLTEFETATAALPEDQRKKLLVKSFPSGRLNDWYEHELVPTINVITWKAVKAKIIERFSDVEDRDRHILRIEKLKFNQNGSAKLYDHVEELLYSIGKAFPKILDEESKIRYIKAKLPSAILPTLLTITSYNTATTINQLKEACRLYDKLNAERSSSEDCQSDKTKANDLMQAIKVMVETTLKQQLQSKNVVSAIDQRSLSPARQSQHREIPDRQYQRRDQSPGYSGYQRYQDKQEHPRYSRSPQRTPSPARRSIEPNQYYNNNYNRNINNEYKFPTDRRSNDQPNNYYQQSRYNNQKSGNDYQNRQYNRSPSPSSRYNNQLDNKYSGMSQDRQNRANEQPDYKPEEAFDLKAYYQKFGVPPSPCSNCHKMHWIRHCHQSLN